MNFKDDDYYKGIDKRTKEYKEWKAWKDKSEGLGDTVEKVLNSKPLKKITEAVKGMIWKDGEDCGCDQRKEKLNKLFPYKKTECLTEEEYQYLDEFFKHNTNQITYKKQDELLRIYNRVTGEKKKRTSCGMCVKGMISKLNEIYKAY